MQNTISYLYNQFFHTYFNQYTISMAMEAWKKTIASEIVDLEFE